MFRDSSWAASWLCFASGVEHRIYVLVIALAVVGYAAVPIYPFSSALVAASPLLSVLCTLKFRPHTLHNFYSSLARLLFPCPFNSVLHVSFPFSSQLLDVLCPLPILLNLIFYFPFLAPYYSPIRVFSLRLVPTRTSALP